MEYALDYSKNIIKAHGAEIKASSVIGKGTKFVIVIPNEKKDKS